jgi:hypothetical protein
MFSGSIAFSTFGSSEEIEGTGPTTPAAYPSPADAASANAEMTTFFIALSLVLRTASEPSLSVSLAPLPE